MYPTRNQRLAADASEKTFMRTDHRFAARLVALGLLACLGGGLCAGTGDLPPAGAEPSVSAPPPSGPEALKPWEEDFAAEEAARKIVFHERLTRWSEEPTANQLAVDARAYDLALSVDPVTESIAGTLVARMEVSGPAVEQIDLDLATGLVVTEVTVEGAAAAFTHATDLLAVHLGRTYLPGEQLTVGVSYAGTPPSSYGAFGFDEHDGQPMIWSLSEPFGARSWWPCDDWSDDKADSVDLRVTVPAGLIVASNGKLREVSHDGATDTWWWHEGYPIATYLVSIAVHPYAVSTDSYVSASNDTLPIEFYMFPGDAGAYADENALTSGMIAFFATVFGEYPFMGEKYGHAEFLWGGGMEHQTCTSLGAFFESIIAHELAHQWWGDMVTCADFHHIWVNEGFARYAEALWFEHTAGAEGYRGRMSAIRTYTAGTIYVPELSDWGRIFDTELTYNKAAWVLHMLRGVLGDEDFFAFLLAYREAHAYGPATTEDVQAAAESVSGMDLGDFFQQWIYGEYYPVYEYTWANETGPGGPRLYLAIDQVQTDTGLFHMPIPVRVTLAGGGIQELTVDHALAHQEYRLVLSAEAEYVELDPDEWILRRVIEPIVDPTFGAGVLLVNGVDWATYGDEIVSAYEDRAFWGDLEISFWDYFTKPDGYPTTLPEPLGHGRVPGWVLGDYLAVIWVGDNRNGDLDGWLNTSIPSYLEAGGNVILLTRFGEKFLDVWMRDYLGITVTATERTLYDCVSVHPELGNIARLGSQSSCAVFARELSQPTSALLFEARLVFDPDVGIGVLRVPEEGGTHNPKGGQFAFVSGRPYRWDHANLAANVETIVGWIQDAWAGAPEPADREALFSLAVPSPALGQARIRLSSAAAQPLRLTVYDAQGRQVRELFSGTHAAGIRVHAWDGRTDAGAPASSGMYFVRVGNEEGAHRAKRLLLVR